MNSTPDRIVLDLEATCWQNKPHDKQMETIEIGAVLVDKGYNTIDEFQRFVKPVINPELSDFCTSLTSITQGQVDNAKTFPEALEEMKEWVQSHGKELDELKLSSWGYYDKKQLKSDCDYHGIPYPFGEHNSLKHDYAKVRKCKPCGMTKALNKEDLELIGTHHRGIDDTRNITRIAKKVWGS